MNLELPSVVLHWNYRGFTEFPIKRLEGDEDEITDIYLKENLISEVPQDIGKLVHLESLYLSGNDIRDLPKEISQLQCLKCLDISGNRLRKVPEDIGDLRGLKFLILDENELTELPLRLAELRRLRYLSVCDNNLQWLPQRPVYNYYHCEFRFWRNRSLRTIPYSLWYHMFREQQTRSLDIGCLKYSTYKNQQNSQSRTYRCHLLLTAGSRQWEFEVDCSPQYETIFDGRKFCPPSLFEMSKRTVYQTICRGTKQLNDKLNDNIICNNYYYHNYCSDDNAKNLQAFFQDIHIDNDNDTNDSDLNGNIVNENNNKNQSYAIEAKTKEYYAPKDFIEEHFSFLPIFIKEDLCRGPVSRCENSKCKKPIFDYAFLEFCTGKIILIDNVEEVILSAALCSRDCVNIWRKTQRSSLQWSLTV